MFNKSYFQNINKVNYPLLDEIVTVLKSHKSKRTEGLKALKWDNIKVKEQTTKGFVFINELGCQIETRNFQRIFYTLVEKANIPDANFHALRHTLKYFETKFNNSLQSLKST
jgi:integrase